MKKIQIGIMGSAGNEEYPQNNKKRNILYKLAEELGEILGKKKIILFTGGKGGIMESASKGAKQFGGTTIGVVKGKDRNTCNKYIDIEIVSGMEGCGEETMLILSCDGIIALGGGAGTLQELTIAYRNKKPVVILDINYGWASKLKGSYLDERKNEKFVVATNPEEAVNKILDAIKRKRNSSINSKKSLQ